MTRRRILNQRRDSRTFDFTHDKIRYTASVSFFPESGAVAELFLRGGKTGSGAEIAAHDGAIVLSLALQFGVPIGALHKALLKLPDGSAAGPLGKALDIIEA